MPIAHPEADQAIERGLPLKELSSMFPTRPAAYEYYGRRMASRFASVDRYCAHCGQLTDESPFTFSWQANIHTAKTVFLSFALTSVALLGHHIVSKYIQIRFQTHHRLCVDCRRRHRLITFFAGALHYVLFAFMILLVFLTTPAVLFLIVAIFYAPELRMKALGATIVGAALLALVAAGFEMLCRWPIPSELRHIGRFPFVLESIKRDA